MTIKSLMPEKAAPIFKFGIVMFCLVAAILAGCNDPAPPAPAVRPVRTITVGRAAETETVSETGLIQAQEQASLAFRIEGRLIERRVNIGDTVKPGQVIGRLDPQIQQNALRRARANLSAVQGQLVQARNSFARQQELLKDGFTPLSSFDQAQQALQTAEAQLESAKAQHRDAQEQLSYTELLADDSGTITATGAEPGEVVAAGRMIVQVARKGGRDAVFDVSAQIIRTVSPDSLVEVALTNDPTVKATGQVREVGPQADPTTRTFLVKVGLDNPPQAMKLGATVTGRITLTAPEAVEVPASALTEANDHPAVWVIDRQAQTVSLRHVEILRHDPDNIIVSRGLEIGDVVVTAGTQVLWPGRKVRLLDDSP
jgi:RND family efflux transporter MFP subunit